MDKKLYVLKLQHGEPMKKMMMLSLSLIVFSVFGSLASEEMDCEAKILKSYEQAKCEFREFLVVIIHKDDAFRKHYEEARKAVRKVIANLNEDGTLDSGFQIEALQTTKKAQRELEEFKDAVSCFQDSLNPNIRKITKEFLKLNEYGSVLLELDYNFIKSPEEFLASKDGVNKLAEHTALLKEQYEYIGELLKKTNEVESTNPREVTGQIEFQYSEKELKAMDKWKDKAMNDLISDAHNGDAVALYMMGLSYLYGQGGFPINIESADIYFATSALLGFAPAIDKIKGMYLEDVENPNPMLFYVYLNLTASFGHPEFTMIYHDQRKHIAEKFGSSMVKEIERIAAAKTLKILEAKNQIEDSAEKMRTTFNLLHVEGGIIGEDVNFGPDYWENFFKKNGF